MKNYTKALIIDDDPDLCLLLKSVLDNTIPEVEYTHNLKSVKKFLLQMKPDVIFLDNNLPDGQGVSLVKEIKSIAPSSLIIFITAMDGSRDKALIYGVDAFLDKPFTYTSVCQTLSKLHNLTQKS